MKISYLKDKQFFLWKNEDKLRFRSNPCHSSDLKTICEKLEVKKGEPLSERAVEDVIVEEEEEQANLNSAMEIATIAENILEKIEDDIPDIKDHPIIVEEISICDLAKAIKINSSNIRKVKPHEIVNIIEKIGAEYLREKSFRGKDKKPNLEILASQIKDYV